MSGEVSARQNTLITLAEKCLEDGADIVFFPEAFQYVRDEKVLRDTELLRRVSAEWQKRCAELARRYHAYVVPWDYYADEKGDVYNSSYILGREGELIGRYCKCNLTYGEIDKGIKHGCEIPVFDLDIGKVGIMICFDNYFPEVAASLGNKGAELILYPLYGDTLKPQWEMKMRTRAIDHSLYVASCQIEPHTDIAYTGIADPEGNVIAKLEDTDTYKVVEVSLGHAVITNTAVNRNIVGEDLHEYLHKSRNFRAYGSLSEEGTKPKEWNDIFIK